MAINTGARAGEIWGLQVHDIASDGKSIWIRRQFNRVTLDFGPTKGKKARHVPCSEALLFELNQIIKNKNLKGEDTIFRNENGLPVCHDNFLDRQFMKDLAAWGGKQIRFHDMRHTATTLMMSMGIDARTIQDVCGHSDITTTMGYSHLLPGSVARVSQIFSVGPVKSEETETEETKQILKLP